MNYELNRFFDNCAKEVKDNYSYINQYIDITSEEVKKIKTKQPNINIAILSRIISELANPVQKTIVKKSNNGDNSLTKEIVINDYGSPFDNALTALWFCYYRFMIITKLQTIYTHEIDLTEIVYRAFFKFMKYSWVDKFKDGQQVTAFFNQILSTVIVTKLRQIKNQKKIILSEDTLDWLGLDESYELDITTIEDNQSDISSYPDISDKIKQFINNNIQDELVLKDLEKLIKNSNYEISERSRKILDEYLSKNNLNSYNELLNKIINDYKEYDKPIINEILS